MTTDLTPVESEMLTMVTRLPAGTFSRRPARSALGTVRHRIHPTDGTILTGAQKAALLALYDRGLLTTARDGHTIVAGGKR